ncbi:MAG: hypothetical protein HWE39_08925 [Oceanospirillaceae bacterium]|nr:hypothetical protein [Oceanospirillaceae bacterium]
MHFVVTAYDYTDEEAIIRRLDNRDAHLNGLEKISKEGIFKSGGAILDKNGKMVGSSVHVEFPNIDLLNEWLNNDPYMIGKVWEKIEVQEVKLFKPEI